MWWMAWWWTWWWTIGAEARDLTLGEAFEVALASNLEVRQARIRLERSDVAVMGAAGATYDPVLSATVGVLAPPFTTLSQTLPTGGNVAVSTGWQSTTVSLSQPLLAGSGPRAALFVLRSAKLALTDEELSFRATVEQLVLDVSRAYWRQVAAEESLRLAVRSREIAERSVADTEERFAEGFAGSADLHQVRRALGAARQSEVVAGAEVESATADLRRQIGLAVRGGEALRLVDLPKVPESDPELAVVLASALEGNAQWRRDRLSVQRADLQFRQARNAALPDLSISGSYALDSTWGLTANFSTPLPGRSARSSRAVARMEREVAALSLEAAEQDLHLRVQDAVRAVARDRSRLVLATETLEVAQLGLEADQELLRDGRGSARDVVISLESLDQAQVDRLRAEIDLQASLLELQRVAGTLLASLGLEDQPK